MNFVESLDGFDWYESPTFIYDDNTVCITQMQTGYKEKYYSDNIFFLMS